MLVAAFVGSAFQSRTSLDIGIIIEGSVLLVASRNIGRVMRFRRSAQRTDTPPTFSCLTICFDLLPESRASRHLRRSLRPQTFSILAGSQPRSGRSKAIARRRFHLAPAPMVEAGPRVPRAA